MMLFVEGEDDFMVVQPNLNPPDRIFRYQEKELRLVPEFYQNGWLALSLENPDNQELYTILTVNLEEMPAFGIPDKAFIDINNNPEALDFLTRHGLAEDTGYSRQSGWINYPMVKLNLPVIYKLNPFAFQKIEIM